MDDPNFNMEEYIRLEEEKARRHGRTFNWQTATFGKIKNYEDEDDCFIDFETEFPAIVFYNTTLPSKPTVCPPNKNKVDFRISLDESDDEDYMNVLRFNDLFNIIRPDDLKSEKDNYDNDIDIIQSSEGNETTPEANGLSETTHDKIIKTFRRGSFIINLKVNIMIWNCYVNGMLFFLIINLYVPFGIPFDPKLYYKDGSHTKIAEANIWHHYPLLIRDTLGSDTRLRDTPRVSYVDLAVRLRMVYTGEGQQVMSDTEMGLNVTDTLCFQLGGIRRRMMWREFILALGLHTEQEMAEAGLLGPRPFLCSYSRPCEDIVPQDDCLQYFWHAEGRKNGARLSGGHFIGRLAMHFSLVGDKGLRGLQVVTRELLLIDLHEVGRLNICSRFGDTWAWVAQGPERQQAATAGAHEADEAGPAAKEGAQEIPAPAQACKELSRALPSSSLESPPG
ncbi:hypothetical protein Tco_0115676 [Tanacetum coccineum]